VIIAAHKLLANAKRRLALRNPSTELFRALQHRQMESMFDGDLRRAAQSGTVQ
jgi:hypothetical protein